MGFIKTLLDELGLTTAFLSLSRGALSYGFMVDMLMLFLLRSLVVYLLGLLVRLLDLKDRLLLVSTPFKSPFTMLVIVCKVGIFTGCCRLLLKFRINLLWFPFYLITTGPFKLGFG